MPEIIAIADAANMIVRGYAFTEENGVVRVLNLNNPQSAAVLDMSGETLETTMDDIELSIVQGIFASNRVFMEADSA